MLTGKIRWFNPVRNFGFIEPNEKGNDVFFYGTEFESDGPVTLKSQMWVKYEAIETAKGPRATSVALCEPKQPRRSPEGVKPISEYEVAHGTQ